MKFSPDKIDTMIVQAVSLLDDLDKELNNYIMRCREWYGWHFPEMGKVVTDNLAYVRTVQKMGMRVNAASTDLSEILPEEVEVAVKVNADLYLPLDLKGQRFIIPCFHYRSFKSKINDSFTGKDCFDRTKNDRYSGLSIALILYLLYYILQSAVSNVMNVLKCDFLNHL